MQNRTPEKKKRRGRRRKGTKAKPNEEGDYRNSNNPRLGGPSGGREGMGNPAKTLYL